MCEQDLILVKKVKRMTSSMDLLVILPITVSQFYRMSSRGRSFIALQELFPVETRLNCIVSAVIRALFVDSTEIITGDGAIFVTVLSMLLHICLDGLLSASLVVQTRFEIMCSTSVSWSARFVPVGPWNLVGSTKICTTSCIMASGCWITVGASLANAV